MLPTSRVALIRILLLFGILCFVIYAVLGCLAYVVRADDTPVAPLPGQVVVRLSSCNAAPAQSQSLFHDWSRVQADAAGALAACKETYPIYPVHAYDLPNDPQTSQQYNLGKMSLPQAWNTARGDGVVIAVLDTGADLAHPDLSAKFVSRGRDFVNGDDDASDDHGHGTHVSGIAAAATNNGVGIAGVGYNARLLPVKVLSASGQGDTARIAQAIDWASQQAGVKVINMSLGCQCPSPAYLTEAVANARARGVVVIAAAGNDGTSSPASPASAPGVIGVGATDSADRRTSFSNYGVNAKLAAPGLNIYSTLRGGSYGTMSGTSMASPNVAGVAALAWSACPSCSVGDIEARLMNGDDIGGQQVGKRVNAARAVGGSGGPTLTPVPTVTYPTPTPAPDRDGQIVAAINQQRAAQGLGPLALDPALVTIARAHNAYMDDHNCFDHQCSGEPSVWQRLAQAGYPNYAGSETIARGYDTVSALVNGWMNSSGHRAILLGNYTHVGCAWDEYDSGYMGRWMTCDFGRRSGVAPLPTATPARSNRAQPPGYFMVIEVPYDTSTQAQIDALYRDLCAARWADGVRCAWHRYRTLEEETP